MTIMAFKKIFPVLLLLLVVVPGVVSAHQPRIVESRQTVVADPEISKAYYGQLMGVPDIYTIQASTPFNLYINILVPDIAGQKKDVSVGVIKNGDVDKPLAVLNGIPFEWKKFYEPFGADTYWMGPEFKARVEAGTYEIRVWSSNNDSKYSLAIGEIEAFDGKEGLNALTIIPKLKKNFFNISPIGFIASPFGWGLIVAMYLLAGVVGFAYRAILKRVANPSTGSTSSPQARSGQGNIGKSDRIIRLAIGVALLLFAITTSWSPILIFFSGFAVFEAMFSWCGFYAALGKNTCPVE